MIKMALSLIALAGMAYAVFFVPLGKHTMSEHVVRIAGTNEAKALKEDLGRAKSRLTSAVEERIAQRPVPSTSPP